MRKIMRRASGTAALGLAALIGLGLAGQQVQAGAITAADSARLAQQALNDGKIDRAVRHAERALRRGDETDAVAYAAQTVLCLAHLRTDRVEAALDACDAAVTAKPDSWRALNNRGIARYKALDFDGAASDYQAAVEAGGPVDMLTANLTLAEKKAQVAQR